MHLRHIAHADVGAALGSDQELHAVRARGFDRQPNAHFLAVGLLLAEELVLVNLALRELRPPQRDRGGFGGEAEALAVEVIAVGDGVADFRRTCVERACGKAEGLVRLEQLVRVRPVCETQHGHEQQSEEQQSSHGIYAGRVSESTHSR